MDAWHRARSAVRPLLAFGWGVLVAAPLLRQAVRLPAASRPARRTRRGRSPGGDIEAALPLAADVLVVALGAGLTPYLSLQVAARSTPVAVAARLASILTTTDGGDRLADALEAEAAATPAVQPLLEVLLASERLGAPVAGALARLAADGRARARQAALARARTIPVRLLFPLVFLVLPAFLLLTVAPVLLAGVTP